MGHPSGAEWFISKWAGEIAVGLAALLLAIGKFLGSRAIKDYDNLKETVKKNTTDIAVINSTCSDIKNTLDDIKDRLNKYADN